VVFKGSPNFGYPDGTPGRSGQIPRAIVLHIMEGTLEGAASWFNNPNSSASAHYGIGKDGRIWQFVDENNAAWANGQVRNATWRLLIPDVNPNLYTISIEHEGKTGEPWTEAMYQADLALIRDIAARWKIPLDRDHIIGHYQLDAVNRQRCPGTGLPWDRLIADLQKGTAPVGDTATGTTPGLPVASAAFQAAAWNALQVAYNPDAAFFVYARQKDLGIPLTNEFDFSVGGKQYRGQLFHKVDTVLVYAEIGKWDQVTAVKVG